MKQGDAVFVDTSIQIARMFHSDDTQHRIERRLDDFNLVVTCDVVQQEFRRRISKEAVYLLNQINKRGDLRAVLQHVANVLPPAQSRKRTICLDILGLFFGEATEPELTDRARRYLRSWLRVGMRQFDASVGHVVRDAQCACATYPIVEREPYVRYELPPTKCSRMGRACGIASFLAAQKTTLQAIASNLASKPQASKSREILDTEQFIAMVLGDDDCAHKYDPCLTVGDLVIALESANIPVFFTLNGKESQHYCKVLGQRLIVRPVNPERDDIDCPSGDSVWPQF